MTTLTLSLLALLSCPQTPTEGIHQNRPAVVLVHETPTGTIPMLNGNTLYGLGPGPQTITPQAMQTADPLNTWDSALGDSDVNIGGFSRGFAFIHCNEERHAVVDQGAGLVSACLTYSVSRGTTGGPGNKYGNDVNTSHGVGGNLYTIWLPGSLLPDVPLMSIQKARDGAQLSTYEITGLDQFMYGYVLDPTVGNPLNADTRIYFTVTDIDDVPETWFYTLDDTFVEVDDRNVTTIFLVKRDLTGGGWSTPKIYKTHEQLQLADQVITALCVSEEQSRILLSTPIHPFWVIREPVSGSGLSIVGDYLQPNGDLFANAILGIDGQGGYRGGIDALCMEDPVKLFSPSSNSIRQTQRTLGVTIDPAPVTSAVNPRMTNFAHRQTMVSGSTVTPAVFVGISGLANLSQTANPFLLRLYARVDNSTNLVLLQSTYVRTQPTQSTTYSFVGRIPGMKPGRPYDLIWHVKGRNLGAYSPMVRIYR